MSFICFLKPVISSDFCFSSFLFSASSFSILCLSADADDCKHIDRYRIKQKRYQDKEKHWRFIIHFLSDTPEAWDFSCDPQEVEFEGQKFMF